MWKKSLLLVLAMWSLPANAATDWLSCYHEGNAALRKNQVALAEQSFKDALHLAREEQPNKHFEALSCFGLGQCSLARGDSGQAVELLQASDLILSQLGEAASADRIATLTALARAYEEHNKTPDAEHQLFERIKLEKHLFGPTNPRIARSLANIGAFALRSRRPAALEQVITELSALAQKTDSDKSSVESHLSNIASKASALSGALAEDHELEKARAINICAESCYQKLGRSVPEEQVPLLLTRAKIEAELKNNAAADAILQKARVLALQSKSQRLQKQTLMALAARSDEKHDRVGRSRYLSQLPQESDGGQKAVHYYQQALSAMMSGKQEAAEELINKALAQPSLPSPSYKVTLTWLKAEIVGRLGKRGEQETLLRNAVSQSRSFSELPELQTESNRVLAGCLLAQGKKPEAEKVALQAVTTARNDEHRSRCLLTLGQIQNMSDKPADAEKTFEKALKCALNAGADRIAKQIEANLDSARTHKLLTTQKSP